MRIAAVFLLMALPAHAQGFAGSSLSAPASKSDIDAMRALVPGPCGAVPAPDTLTGTAGSATCYVPRDAARPTAVQAANVQTDANGAWSVTWARAFVSGAPVITPLPVNTGSMPMLCNVAARDATKATGRCWLASTTSLSGVLSSVLVNPFSANAVSAPVMVLGREPTQ